MQSSLFSLFLVSVTVFAIYAVFLPYVFAEGDLGPPTDLEVDVVSSTQIDLSWNAPSDADSIIGYKIEHRKNTDTDYSVVIENTGSVDTTYSHTNLTPDTVYAYRIYGISSAGYGESSSSVTVKTPSNNNSNTDEPLSDIPTDVTATAISATSVEISWKPPTQTYGQTIQGYSIKQEIAPGTYDEIATATSSQTNYVLSGLSTDEKYVFVVVADYSLGSSDISKKTSVTLSSGNNAANNNEKDNDSTVTPDDVPDRPTNLETSPVSSTRIDLSWDAPDDDDDNNAAITGYKIEVRTATDSSYEVIEDDTKTTDTKYSHTGLDPNTDYIYRVSAINSEGTSDSSREERAKTLSESDNDSDDSTVTPDDVPDRPTNLETSPVSSTRIDLSWDAPDDDDDNNAAITGYKIEVRTATDSSYEVIEDDTKTTDTKYSHTGLDPNTDYIYRVSAINSEGTSDSSREERAKTLSESDNDDDNTSQNISSDNTSNITQNNKLKLNTPTRFTIEQGETLSFQATLSQSSDTNGNLPEFSLDNNAPIGAIIDSSTGQFNWQPTKSHVPDTYEFDVVVSNDLQEDRQTITVIVTELKNEEQDSSETTGNSKQNSINAFSSIVDKTKDPQHYIDRYNNESVYKEWFDTNFPEITIYEALGINKPDLNPVIDPEPSIDQERDTEYELDIAPFVDKTKDPQHYIDRYNNESVYKEWFDKNYSEYDSIYQAVGLTKPTDGDILNDEELGSITCGVGTELIDGMCMPIEKSKTKPWWQFW